MRKWKKVVTVFKICPCPMWHGPTHSPFYVCFYDSFCILMKGLKICSVWIHIYNSFERIVKYLLTLSGKSILCIFSQLDRYMNTYVRNHTLSSANYFFRNLIQFFCHTLLWQIFCANIIDCKKSCYKSTLRVNLSDPKVCKILS